MAWMVLVALLFLVLYTMALHLVAVDYLALYLSFLSASCRCDLVRSQHQSPAMIIFPVKYDLGFSYSHDPRVRIAVKTTFNSKV